MFLSKSKGFSLSSATATWQDVIKIQQMFLPYVHSKVYQVVSVEEGEEVLKSMMPKK